MSLNRYTRSSILGFGTFYGTSKIISVIREKIASGDIRFREDFVREAERLDTIAGAEYGDAKLYWVIAAASNIGWCLQVPPGTVIKIPNITDISRFIG